MFITYAENECWARDYRFGYAFRTEWYRCGAFEGDGCDSGVWQDDNVFSRHNSWEV